MKTNEDIQQMSIYIHSFSTGELPSLMTMRVVKGWLNNSLLHIKNQRQNLKPLKLKIYICTAMNTSIHFITDFSSLHLKL